MQDHNGLAYFTWDSNGLNLLAEKDTSGNTTAQYTHGYTPIQGIGSLVEAKKEIDGCTYYQYPIYDHRGTVVKLVDENAQTIEKYHYNAWGFPFQYDDKARNRFGWQSNWIQLPISNAGLFLSPTRIYSAKEGRFLQRDWIKSINIYQSFNNNPLMYNDILGLSVVDIEEQMVMPLETGGGGGGCNSGNSGSGGGIIAIVLAIIGWLFWPDLGPQPSPKLDAVTGADPGAGHNEEKPEEPECSPYSIEEEGDKKNCNSPQYKKYSKCNFLKTVGYNYESEGKAFKWFKSRWPNAERRPVHLKYSNVCKPKNKPLGRHIGIEVRGTRVGNIFTCKCCDDSQGNPNVKEIAKVVPD